MTLPIRRLAMTVVVAVLCGACARDTATPGGPARSTQYADLVRLFEDWRLFQAPRFVDGVPDYSAGAMAAQHRALADYQRRLEAIDPSAWPVPQQVDHHIVRAEMNGLDFDHRVLKPWVRDPEFYAVVNDAQSDVPAHEGPGMHGAIETWTYTFPVTADRIDELRVRLKAVPRLLEEARRNLTGNARDLWAGGVRSWKEQPAALDAFAAKLAPHHADLAQDARQARKAADDFIAWLESELPNKNGPSGVGVENYNWYLKHVHLLSYTWQDEVALVKRELARAHAALRLSEHRNRKLPPQAPLASEAEHTRRFNDAVTEYVAFFRDHEIQSMADYMDRALRERIGRFNPPPLEFFTEVDYRDPVVMRTHGYHWFDLARMAASPHPSPIRRGPLLYNIWDGRAEGMATGMEEMMMHAGLFDAKPRSRELIYVLLAQRGARAMGDLMMHANQWTIEQAAKYAVQWTPRGWLRPDATTVWFEQHLYLQQPAYGTSYLIGKIEIEKLIAERSKQQGDRFTLRGFMDEFAAAGLIPVSLIRWEVTGQGDEIAAILK